MKNVAIYCPNPNDGIKAVEYLKMLGHTAGGVKGTNTNPVYYCGINGYIFIRRIVPIVTDNPIQIVKI